ncbi:MAG: T9SS type A sorting domain-containing protein, partial [Ignavibacteriales bacterium]|nr:T9SS type A sorting domain-containing protein [Ignavibacteriales bacterium]
FDTETGRTAIGRFGLMDGQSIFSFSGICPPEPSAWEKSFMGWTTPIEVYGNKTLSLPAVSLYESGNDTIYKIPISAKEYFLVENRQRDAKNDSQKVTMKWNGQIISKTFTRDENFYSNSNIDSIYGVVLDVDELDWSLPGLINDNNNYRGGILVWHIDETIVEKNLASNSINADPLKRGVDVEEADGSQDIGQTYDFVSPGSGSEDGSPIDYWFSGNISPVYKNVFSETTNPNSLSNSFAKSHITLKNFSSSSPRMTFEANVGETNIRLLKTIRRSVLKMSETDSPLLLDLNADYFPEILFTHGDSILILKNNFTPFFENTALLTSIGGDFAPSVSFGGITSVGTFVLPTLYGIHDSTVFFFSFRDVNQNGVVDTIVASKLQFPAKITTPVMQDVDYVEKNLGLSNGSVFNLKDSTYRLMSTTLPIVTLSDLYVYNQRSVLLNQPALYSFESNVIGGAELYDDNIIVLTDDQKITFIKTQKNTFGFITHTDRIVIHAPGVSNSYALGDINKDGKVDLVIGIGTKIFAYTSNGVILDHFPISTVDGGKVIGGPVILNLNTTKEPVIIFGSSNGHLYATDQKGDMISGFPLQTSGIYSSPSFNRNILAVASSDSSIYFWDTGNLFDTTNVYFQWTGYLGGFRHSNNVVSKNASVPAKSSELLPKSFAYNWPNPVYDNKTNIRYFLGKSATVKIKIINMAGELVDELNGTNYVGLDNEVQWDVSKIQSGIYFAQITASGNGGEQSQIIKIAVVK